MGGDAVALPVIAVTGMAFEARIARGAGMQAVYAARADLLERALNEALARGAAGVVSFGTAGGLAPDLEPGTVVIADAIDGPFGRVQTDVEWSERMAAELAATPLRSALRRGTLAAVGAPVVTVADKAALHRVSGALAVDMESHIVAKMAAERGLPFAVCRAIVDPAWRTLPPAAMAGLRDDGTTAVMPVLVSLAKAPRQLGALLRVAADARAARIALMQARHAVPLVR
ncbi:phosphorylase [Trinickia fusca]|uniref:Phosphorylase n=1 Tax=Trinickia fusca TaxID=2419777 RepID=A0A494XJW6_9BURK|nr:phosphorylase [Trinickia fusca]RKP48374.1 phosphorylase [Trinickia fusca]